MIMIKKEEFLNIYNKNKPCKFTKFVYRLNGVEVDGKKSPKKYIITFLLILFLIGFFSTIFNFDETIIKYSTLLFAGIIIPVVISIFIGIFLNMRRIKRIMKQLKLNDTKEYNKYADLYIK